ncbi:melatonin receptor type 1B-A-like [Babylonia areolata]|uniref:melatonin receptor type 1B-A-like n=1 Tax=Babylonia areolata TaxID=304850 RepID=UPI003FD683E9
MGEPGGQDTTSTTTVSHYEPYEFLEEQPALSSLIILILIAASVAGTSGNILILVSVATQRDLQNVESVFIVNLACSDLYVTLIADPLSVVGKTLGWRFFADHPELCKAVGGLCTVSCVASLMTLSAVSVNRYILICYQRLYRRLFTLRTTLLLCLSFYLVGLLFVVLNFAGIGDHSFDHRTLECIWDRMADHRYTRFFGVVMVLLPIILTGLCYARLYLRVRNSRLKVHHHQQQRGEGGGRKTTTTMKLARTLFIIYMVFSACWLPYAVLLLLEDGAVRHHAVHLVIVAWAHLHPSLNWLVYYHTHSKFRAAFRKLLRLDRCCRCK